MISTPITTPPFTSVNATFTYDGDGKMVKAVIDGVTTLYVSAVYQVKGSVVTKYYIAGDQVVAIRTGSTLSYLLSDHIGSNSITVSDTGTKTAETRYKAWGEVRYQSGTNPSDRTYTGQRSYASDFGLMYYNARWYDSSIGRFAQADNIDIKVGDTQSLDRFAYVSNNPISRTDPTGHKCINYWDSAQSKTVSQCYPDAPKLDVVADASVLAVAIYHLVLKAGKYPEMRPRDTTIDGQPPYVPEGERILPSEGAPFGLSWGDIPYLSNRNLSGTLFKFPAGTDLGSLGVTEDPKTILDPSEGHHYLMNTEDPAGATRLEINETVKALGPENTGVIFKNGQLSSVSADATANEGVMSDIAAWFQAQQIESAIETNQEMGEGSGGSSGEP